MTEPTANTQKPDTTPPMIRGGARKGEEATKPEVNLWMNTPKVDENGKEIPLSPNAPDMRGYVVIGAERHSVSAWYKPGREETADQKAHAPFLSLALNVRNPDNSYTTEARIGTLNAQTKFGDQVVDGTKGLAVRGTLKSSAFPNGIEVTSYINRLYPDKDAAAVIATELGFPEAAVKTFRAEMDAPRQEKASAPRP